MYEENQMSNIVSYIEFVDGKYIGYVNNVQRTIQSTHKKAIEAIRNYLKGQ